MGIDGIENLMPEPDPDIINGKINAHRFIKRRKDEGKTRQEVLKDLLNVGLGISDCRALLNLYWEE